MDNTNQNPTPAQQPAIQPPVIPESELKLPEEGVNGVNPTEAPKHAINPLLIGLLVLLLAVLAAVVIWGEDLIGLVLPEDTVELPPIPEDQSPPTDETDINELEAEIEQNEAELNALEQEWDQLEVTIETNMDTEATTTATTTN